MQKNCDFGYYGAEIGVLLPDSQYSDMNSVSVAPGEHTGHQQLRSVLTIVSFQFQNSDKFRRKTAFAVNMDIEKWYMHF